MAAQIDPEWLPHGWTLGLTQREHRNSLRIAFSSCAREDTPRTRGQELLARGCDRTCEARRRSTRIVLAKSCSREHGHGTTFLIVTHTINLARRCHRTVEVVKGWQTDGGGLIERKAKPLR